MTDAWCEVGRRAGMSERQAADVAALLARCGERLDALPGRSGEPRRAFFVPGRIEVLGKHTDYAGGRSLLCATERGFAVIGRPRADRLVRVVDAGWDVQAEFAIDAELAPAVGDWTNYPQTVARRLARNFPGAGRGVDLVLASNLPADAGMSSSSALLIGCFLALAEANDLAARADYRAAIAGPEDLAGYLGTVENGQSYGPLAGDRGVGTFGGSEDHTAMLCCRAGALSQFAFCPVRHERSVEVPPGWTFVVAASGVAAPKTGAARELYNRAARATARLLGIWIARSGRDDRSLADAVRAAPGGAAEVRAAIAEADDSEFGAACLLARFDQFVEESDALVPEAAAALTRGDVVALGRVAARSQAAAERGLGNQTAETSRLVRLARDVGAVAASAFGAGFGGSVWALVEEAEADAFGRRWSAAYASACPMAAARAVFLETRPGPPACRLA